MTETLGYIPEIDYPSRGWKPLKKAPPGGMCGRCEVYYQGLFDKGVTKTPFPPTCQKHVMNRVRHLKEVDFRDAAEFESAKILMDPVTWAYSEFGWEPRWGQEETLSCTADKKIYREV